MRFCSWYAAADIAACAPAEPGVFQVRAAALRSYPSGRSAMVHYGVAEDLRAELLAWAAQRETQAQRSADELGELRFRHCAELGSTRPADALAKLLQRFEARFGQAPSLPRAES